MIPEDASLLPTWKGPLYEDIEVVSETQDGDRTYIEILYTDPVTGLRHRGRFELVVAGEQIVSVVEQSEIIESSIWRP
jgi:hypothetical protein